MNAIDSDMDTAPDQNKQSGRDAGGYRGRFAPSPTGPLHFGSLLAAVGSYLQARANKGRWMVRIEDIDPPREVPGAAAGQIETLERFGMVSDEPVVYQSQSAWLHARALENLRTAGLAFDCGCSRRDLPASGIYPGTCRNELAPGKSARSVRFRIPDQPLAVEDQVFGRSSHCLAGVCGDFVIRRADGLIAYQLAVVVDDIESCITEVVRGRDLLDSSPRQQALFEALGAPVPQWMHLPLAVDSSGNKLSKTTRADPVDTAPAARTLALVLQALGHRPPPGARSLESLWTWAITNWDPRRIPREPFEL
ncbi:MAG: tRNA glutamyl-Q(34) synthetase GluQRS [Wenzhouxiangellaceae bacterium]